MTKKLYKGSRPFKKLTKFWDNHSLDKPMISKKASIKEQGREMGHRSTQLLDIVKGR